MNLTYNGHDLTTLFTCGDPEITILDSTPDNREVSGRNGAAFVGMKYGVPSVACTIAAFGTPSERRAKFSTLGQWLMVDEPKPLYLPDTPDRYYLAVPSGALQLTRGFDGETATLTFELTDPVAYGEQKMITLPSRGSLTFTVGGTAPTYFYRDLAAIGTPDASTLRYGIRLDNSQTWCVTHDSTSNLRVGPFDFEKRSLMVDGVVSVPTLDSDWFALTPGEHTLENYLGGGTSLWLKYRERWY